MEFYLKLVSLAHPGLCRFAARQPADMTLNGSVALLERTLAAHLKPCFIPICNM